MNDRPDEFTPYWLQTAMPSTGNGEMPGQPVMFPWEYPWPHTAPRDMWADSTASNPFVPSPPPPFAAPPPWLNTASPFGADFKQPAWPDPSAPHSASETEGRRRPSSRADAVNALSAPVMQPWEYPWPHTLPRDMWVQAMQPTPSAAPPSLFPLAHLDSGKYWPGAPPVANDQPQASSAASWATAAPPHSALKTRVDALLEHLDSAKYWPAAPAWDGDESATAVPQPSPVTATGLAKQGSVALAKALIGVPGMLGDARELGFGIGDWISQKILDRRTLTDQQRLEQAHGADFMPGAAARQRQQRQDEARRNLLVTNPLSALAPSSSDIQGVIEQVTGPFRKPENMPEEYVDTIGQFVPSIFGGPGGWARRGTQWLAPALISETAGQLTKGTEWEPAARFASTIFGGAVPYFFRPSAPRAAPPPAPPVVEPPPPRPAVAGEVPVAAPQRFEDARERAFGAPAPKLNEAGPRGYAPQEAVPGEITEHLPGTRKQPYDWRQEYTGSGWINPETGRDAIAEAMGLAPRSPTLPATGSYQARSGNWETNPAHTGRWTPELTPDGVDLSPRSKSAIRAAEKTRAMLDGQEAGAYHVLIPNAPEASRTSLNIPHSGPLDPTKAQGLAPLADRHGFYMSDRGNSVSLIAKLPEHGGPQTKADTTGLLRGELGQGIQDRWPGAVPTPTRMVSDIVEGIGRPPGKGRATKAWLDTLDRAPPEAVDDLGRSTLVRDKIAGLHARDARLHGTTGPAGEPLGTAQAELQHLRDAATRNRPENWLAAVREAYRANPEAFPAILLPLVAGPGAYDLAVSGD